MESTLELEKQAAAVTSDPRWKMVASRAGDSDGSFFYSVRTTGVYCRPSCGARLARPENVQFHETAEDAERAGFRPCKRCKPNGLSLTAANTAKIAKACRVIEGSEAAPSLERLAKTAGMSAYHFHRTFKAATGVTPADYARAHRSDRVRRTLSGGYSVTDAIYEAGYGSSSRFYESSNEVLGMTAASFQSGGLNTAIHFALGECSLGSVLVAKSERGVCSVLIGDDPGALVHDLQSLFPKAELLEADKDFEELVVKVIGFIEAPSAGLELPLDIRGTAFQRRVWKAIQRIPVGATASYAEIAKQLGAPKAVRAVAQACGANAIAVAIPCHRVVRSDGALSGYRWGAERKRALLEREARAQ